MRLTSDDFYCTIVSEEQSKMSATPVCEAEEEDPTGQALTSSDPGDLHMMVHCYITTTNENHIQAAAKAETVTYICKKKHT